MKKLSPKKFEEFNSIISERGKNVAWKYPLNVLKDPEFFEYDDSYDSEFGGSMPKMFLRCDSDVFKELIEELVVPDCSYVTYLNEFVQSLELRDVKNFPLSKISVMVKAVHQDAYLNREEKASRVANVFGVPTVYNKLVNIKGNKLILSVDCLKENEEFVEIESNTLRKPIYDFNTAILSISNGLKYLVKAESMTQIQLDKLIEDFVELYLFRVGILNDGDFTLQNLGIICNTETGEYKWAPCFDMEYALGGVIPESTIRTALRLIKKDYPEKFVSVVEKFGKVHTLSGLKSLVKVAGSQGIGAFRRLGQLLEISKEFVEMENSEMEK